MNRTYRTAWWLWVLGGLFGLHRLYAGRHISGGVMLGMNLGLLWVDRIGMVMAILGALVLVNLMDYPALKDWFPEQPRETPEI